MIFGRKNILSWFDMQQGKPYFSIMRKSESQSGNYLFTNKDRENETTETARAYLDQCLNLIGTGDFFIYCNEKQQVSSKGRSETFFSLNMNEAPTAVTPVAGVGGFTEDEVDKRARKMFTTLMQEKELADTKKLLAEAQRENKTLLQKVQQPWNQFLSGLAPYIGNIAEQLGVKKGLATALPISGVEEDKELEENVTDFNAEAQAKAQVVVKDFLEAISKLYPDNWMEIVEKLTTTINNDPDKIALAIKFL